MTRLEKEQTLEVAKTDFRSPGDLPNSQYSHERGLQIPVEVDSLFKEGNTY